MNKKIIFICLAGILLAGAALRLYGLEKRGLFYGDEARYYKDSVRMRAGKNFLAAVSTVDKQSFAGKPGHALLGLAGLCVFGNHQYSVLLVSVLLGIATIFLTFLTGRAFYGAREALIAALILSVCAAHVLFSRSFLAHSNQAFFLMLGTYLYLRAARGLASLCFGYAFLVHPTGAIYFVPFLFCELFSWLRKKRRLVNIFVFCLLFLLPFLILTTLTILNKKEFGSLAVALKDSYLEQLIYTHSDAAYRGIETNRNLGIFHYSLMSGLVNGAGFTILAFISIVSGLLYAFRKKGMHNFILLVMPALFFIYWQFISRHERLLREMLVLFPFFSIMMAVFVSRLNKKLIVAILIALIAEGVLYSSRVILQVRADYGKIEKFLAENKINELIVHSEYLATTSDVLMPNLKDLKFYLVSGMAQGREVKKRYGVSHIMVYPGDWLEGQEFRFDAAPLIDVPEPSFAYFPSFYEVARSGAKTEWLKIYKKNPEAVSVGIYEVK